MSRELTFAEEQEVPAEKPEFTEEQKQLAEKCRNAQKELDLADTALNVKYDLLKSKHTFGVYPGKYGDAEWDELMQKSRDAYKKWSECNKAFHDSFKQNK